METQIENEPQDSVTNSSRTKFNRANISPVLYSMFEEARATLEAREVEVSFVAFSEFIAKNLPKGILNSFIEDSTPVEWHLKSMMADPNYKQEFLKLAEKLKKR